MAMAAMVNLPEDIVIRFWQLNSFPGMLVMDV
jgi:hypothetical protein